MERVWLRAMDNVDQNYSAFDLRAGNRRLREKKWQSTSRELQEQRDEDWSRHELLNTLDYGL
jgi:hypothetical protein